MSVTANFDFISREMEFQDEEMVRFIKHEKKKDKKDNTVYKYAAGLEELSKWLDSEGRDHLEVDFVDLGNYTSYLVNERGLADSTCEVKLAGVNEYYKYLLKLSKINENPTEKLDAGDYIDWNSTLKSKSRKDNEVNDQDEDKKRVYLEKDELKDLKEHAPAPKLRNRLIILFTYYTALRVNEVVNVKLDDLDREERTVSVTVKGGKQHTAVWHSDIDGLMTQWIDYGYRDSYPTAADSPYLFPTHRSEQISVRRVNGIIDEAAENAGIQRVLFTDAAGREFKKVTPHCLRHSFAMHFINDGGSFEALNNRLAHSSIITTEIYGEVQDDRSIEEYDSVVESLGTGTEAESDPCLLCGAKENLETHHISYEPEKTIDVCKRCHQKIHHTDQYEHLLDANCEL